jgi:hypothetical protein
MQISSRFTEYGLTGGFFWICQLVVIWWFGQAQAVLSHLSNVQKQIPHGFSSVGSTALSALAIIAVFVTGLLLDLLAVYFRGMEMGVFWKHLVRNRDWLSRLITEHKDYCESDYEQLKQWQDTASKMKRLKQHLKNARAYERLWSFFTSYVLVLSGSTELGLMVDQYHLWRTGRAVSTVLVIVYAEVLWVLPKFLHAPPIPWLGLLLMFALLLVAFMITRQTYSRLCFTLFALVYVTEDKREEDVKNEGEAASPKATP